MSEPTQADVISRSIELPMTAFVDAVPTRDELNGEQTILIHTAAATWDLCFVETGEEFPDRWFGEHWIDISEMWPGVTAQVTEFHREASTAALSKRVEELEAALRLAQPIVEADFCEAKESGDSDWEGLSYQAHSAIETALEGTRRRS